MYKKKGYSFLILVGVAIVLYIIHQLIFWGLNINQDHFKYSLETLYVFFVVLSAILFQILWVVKEKSFDNVGMSFLLATSIKMIMCFVLLRPILQTTHADNSIERINFFLLFIVFLAIETLFTIGLVNIKQKSQR